MGAIRQFLSPGNLDPLPDVIRALNQRLCGWANYFSYGTVTPAYRVVDYYTTCRLRRFLCRRHKVSGLGTRQFPDQRLYDLGLVRLAQVLRQRRSHACGETSPRAGCGKTARPVR